jgi:adenosylcobinamide amidohydrolase
MIAERSSDRCLAVSCSGLWLVARFDAPHAVASWAVVGGGLGETLSVAWRHVEEHELRPPTDAAQWLKARMRENALHGAVGLLTSRRLDRWVQAEHVAGAVAANCVATVGLGNALRAGDPPGPYARIGTINILCRVDFALAPAALLEALAIATEAKTAAILESGVASGRSGQPATGTGTDCIVIACPRAQARASYAGKHTDVGAAIGAAVLDAVRAGALAWKAEQGLR